MTGKEQSRRRFLQVAGIGAGASLAGRRPSEAQVRTSTDSDSNKIPKFKLGLASYTLRKFNLDKTLSMTKRLDLEYIAFKDFH